MEITQRRHLKCCKNSEHDRSHAHPEISLLFVLHDNAHRGKTLHYQDLPIRLRHLTPAIKFQNLSLDQVRRYRSSYSCGPRIEQHDGIFSGSLPLGFIPLVLRFLRS
jgi:hypothetical protein